VCSHVLQRVIRKRTKGNASDGDDETKAYSRCHPTFFFKILDRVRACPRYVELVNMMGFGHTLEFVECIIPRMFVQWVPDHVDTKECTINVGTKSIFLSPQSISETLGTPCGEFLVDTDEETRKSDFLQLFGVEGVSSIRFFRKRILGKEILLDNMFCRCFMAVCLGSFFCPNSNTKVSTKYMGVLVHVDSISNRNWSRFIHEWLMSYIQKYLDNPAKGK
jgi:hypothetical protein